MAVRLIYRDEALDDIAEAMKCDTRASDVSAHYL